MSSSQTGKTQALLNAIGYFADQDPSAILVVQPTVDDAKDFSKERLAAFIRATPRLRAKFAAAKSRDQGNTLLHKEFAGGNITLAGANAPSRLASRPKRIVFADEVDRYPASAGTEGDPVELAIKRSLTFWNRKVVITSTPGVAGDSRVEAGFEEGDQRRFWVPCPHCGHEQTLRWSQVKWDKDEDGQHRPETAGYECEGFDEVTGEVCGRRWSDAERWRAIRTAEDCGGGWRGEKPCTGIASFHSSELYSTFVELAKTVREFLAAKGHPERLKVWTNTSLGETWAERGEAPEWQRLYDRREKGMALGTPPAWAGLLVGAADVQRGSAGAGRIELDIWAFGPGRQRMLVEHIEVDGPVADKATWAKLDAHIAREWKSADGRRMRLARVGIDSGDGESTMHVYAWARRHPGFVMALKGRATLSAQQAIAGPSWVDVTVGGKKLKRGVRLFTVGTSMLKLELYGDLQLEKPTDGGTYPDGYVFLPDGLSDEWIKQLVAEELVKVKRRLGGVRLEWRQIRDRNEALDMAVYARAVAIALGVDRWSQAKWAAQMGANDVPEPAPTKPTASPISKPSRPASPFRGRPTRGGRNPFTGRG